jgi:hypothetical protein
MSQTSPSSARSPLTTSRLTLLGLAILAATVSAACAQAGPSSAGQPSATATTSPATGTVTGAIMQRGGPAPPLDKQGHRIYVPLAGEITVYTTTGKPVTRTVVREGQHFSINLPAGHYLLNSGNKLHQMCEAKPAVVLPHRTIRVNVDALCGVP